MRQLKKLVLFSTIILFVVCCNSITSSNNAPSDHTINKSGVKHKTGLTNPTANCVECHGSDLKGGSVGVSCYSCHGKKW